LNAIPALVKLLQYKNLEVYKYTTCILGAIGLHSEYRENLVDAEAPIFLHRKELLD